jgi:hypothetical protein
MAVICLRYAVVAVLVVQVLAGSCNRNASDTSVSPNFLCAIKVELKVSACDLIVTEAYTLPHESGANFNRGAPWAHDQVSNVSGTRNGISAAVSVTTGDRRELTRYAQVLIAARKHPFYFCPTHAEVLPLQNGT